MILEKNNMHDFDTFNIFKWIFKTFVATYLLTNCFTIVMAVFDVAQNVVSRSAGVINGNLDVTAALADLETQLEAMGMWELIGLWLETNIINLCMWVLSIVIFVIVYGRMIEIYLTVSLAPIPFSTMANREWGQMGTNYLRSLFALGFQGFLILVCVAIYAVLVQSIPASGDIHGAIWGTAGYTVLLAFALFHKRIHAFRDSVNDAATNSLIALMNTAVVTGFGGVVQGSHGFELVKEFALSLDMTPLISACVATAIVAAACGSCSGGLSVFLAALGPQYVQLCQAQGIDPQILHRSITWAGAGLDSLFF